MKNIILSLILIPLCFSCKAQNEVSLIKNESNIERPKLVVGIVVDQMRYDYLTRFYNRFGEGGFKRMMNEGFNCKNNQFNYIPTKTGPGHASIYTGTTPKYHGIIGNDWFDKESGHNVNCVQDDSVLAIGTNSSDAKDGKMSPNRMLTTTFADENRLFTQMQGKTIGISIKHRGAILPAGHTANAAFWLDYDHDGNGNWITSSFYMNDLPQWVKNFNETNITESYFKEWNTLYDINSYTESGSDLNTFERIFEGKETATFPYNLEALKKDNGNFKIIAESPFGNSLITDFTIKAIDAEALGKDDITDVLTVSFSSTDKVGHDFGPNSKEIEDTYLRLDLDLERLFNALDEKVGKGEYTVFLTADHGAPNVINYLLSKKIPAGLFDESQMFDEMNTFLEQKFKVSDLILSRINNQIYLNHDKINSNNIDLENVKEVLSLKLLKYRLIDKVYMTSEINQFDGSNGVVENLLSNGHNQKRSGDLMFVYNPAVFKDALWNRTGTDHHSGFSYDTHVPLLFFGKGIQHGATNKLTHITDIAPTISALLGISFPNACIGQPLEFVLD
ncbi:Predicted pyrophosphatase or phosphodiesterase, AlkP superfamily [Flaviramulus basaltis]|uniref:Predicted pyrophosphatase or phosphodiesterase, AlkP superfamily n=1 Tax=Flaviramulus basaltis TaxID=369401 RepID=A0A1K2IAI1_9FLAO|nr:Predicted pyrophosphatase or phosphodiesterase, AlkP superfamily [Flaviramulus basaltis]